MSFLLMEETRVPGENHRPAASSFSSAATATAALLLFLLRRRHRPPFPLCMYIHCFSEFRRIILKCCFFLLETIPVGIKFTISFI